MHYQKLVGVRPGEPREALDSNETVVLELASVDDIGGFVAALGDNEIAGEAISGSSKVS